MITFQNSFSQNNKLWKGYFCYNEIKDLSESPTKIFAAAENALFTENTTSGEIKTINTIDGLPGQTISATYHSETFKKTIVGYQNGLLIVINEVDGSMLNVVDIINKTLPPTVKKINHFMEYNGIVYISTDFGIVQYNLATLQFGDTYFIGNNGAQIIVKQTAIFENKIYAATFENGMRSASITNPNLNDFNQWTRLDFNGWTGVEAIGNKLIGVSNTGYLYTWQGTVFGNQTFLLQPSVDTRKSGDYLIITTPNRVYIFNDSLALIRTVNSSEILTENVKFTCATVVNEIVYIGTFENGLYNTTLLPTTFENNTPNGPLRNNIFAISTTSQNLWAVYGGYTFYYNPFGFIGNPPTQFGISKYGTNGWIEIPYNNLLEAKALSRIIVNPNNEKEIFISSFHSGLLKIENDVPTILYNQSNSGLEAPAGGSSVRINGTAYDKQGNLWVTNSIVTKGLKVLKTDGQWQSYDLQASIPSSATINYGRLTIDKNGTKWMATRDQGVIGFNENYGTAFKVINDDVSGGNLPNTYTNVVTIDKKNQMWIGTFRGLSVLSSVDSFLSDEPLKTEAIIFLDEGVPQPLLYEQSVTDIVVDGANNKWIGTADSGVYFVSPDGQQTIYHFTISNSPLPSNSVNDIDINQSTGEVFIATSKGMVSFKGTSTEANENLDNVYVYPNPVRPEFLGTVKISGLIDRATVKIADIEGNLVYETTSEGGTIEWDTTAFGKYKVASGVYMVFISSEDSVLTKVKKVMIIR